ncbi:sporulation-control protein [Halopolyspora algeriensis]|uniref:Sporulation-control protein n=1 Tax=Halopolyspora algeriensis TaxID=1500506 RepID=A0A368VYQ9_9ACTN|nr:sporulation protein [Halopolyspora algeriensis]RCW47081.1 sporulation-control protein [Halopolyspora algeriensis]TQM48168.1 sporulation-control protein [Halopolyspora algeriensis]
MFKKLLAAVGVGGAEVETELHTPGVQPGGVVQGVVRLRGGEVAQEIGGVFVELVTRVEHEVGDDEVEAMRGFHRVQVAGGVELESGRIAELPFSLPVPWETPITHDRDHPLRGSVVSVRTTLDIRGAVDATDTDPIGVGALPAQHVLLEAVERLGFRFHKADVEAGQLRGTRQRLPFYQEIEFSGSPHYRRLNQLEVSFVADEHGMDVVLEADKKAGLLGGGRDLINMLRVDYGTVHSIDWARELHPVLESMGSGRF